MAGEGIEAEWCEDYRVRPEIGSPISSRNDRNGFRGADEGETPAARKHLKNAPVCGIRQGVQRRIGLYKKLGSNNYHLEWETVSVVLNNESAIDIPYLYTNTFEKAHEFILGYGFDPNDASQATELEKLKSDAVHFIENQLLQDPDDPSRRLQLPDEVIREPDVRNLMIWASTPKHPQSRWACSLLRVMHTLTHVNNDLASNVFPSIQKQVLDRVLRHVHSDPAGDVYLGRDESGIRLYMLDIKTQKSFESHVLKLLHKPENVSAEVYDRIGFRFVTFNKLEALMVLTYLRENVFTLPNVHTGRSRNTLIDVGRYHFELDRLTARFKKGEIDDREFLKEAARIAESDICAPHVKPERLRDFNLYSSTEYTSIQFTCRQLVRISPPPSRIVPGTDLDGDIREYRFFFPFEIQLLDKKSYIESRRGRASHTEYKRAQLRAARERIFPWLYENHPDALRKDLDNPDG